VPSSQINSLWWAPVVRGIAAILFGIVAVAWPVLTVLVLVILFGVYAIIDGAIAITGAITGKTQDRMGRFAIGAMGVLGLVAGVLTLVWPGATAIALAWLIAFWALVTGVLEIVAAFRLRGATGDFPWLMFLSGVLSVLLGTLLAAMPGRGAISLVWAIGVLAIIEGVVLVALGFVVRREAGKATVAEVGDDAPHPPPAAPA
jgi:uncharacterized membrane protein HdeD (DUF308 family)